MKVKDTYGKIVFDRPHINFDAKAKFIVFAPAVKDYLSKLQRAGCRSVCLAWRSWRGGPSQRGSHPHEGLEHVACPPGATRRHSRALRVRRGRQQVVPQEAQGR